MTERLLGVYNAHDKPIALYFGFIEHHGHGLMKVGGRTISDPKKEVFGFPWTYAHLDTGLLKNGKRADVVDGKVFSTCGGHPLWIAFFWWDRSGDSRGNSNSGFYVRGFEWNDKASAFEYACQAWPAIVARQKVALVLQDRPQ